MSGKRRRVWEWAKSLLILLLTCSAVYLAGSTIFPRQLGGFFSRRPAAADEDRPAAAPALSSQTLRPAALCVTWDDWRYGLLYHQDDPELHTQVSALLAEALSDAAAPVPVPRRRWEQSLAAPGVFCEYLAPMPLRALSGWLSGQENTALASAWAKRLCVTGNAVYFQNDEGGYFTCPLEPDLTGALAGLAGQVSANGAHFAGESQDYGHLRRDTPVLSVTPSLPQLYADAPVILTDPAAPGEVVARLLQNLSFHPKTNPLYTITGGWAINDGGETLRIDASGQLTYRRSDQGEPRFPTGESMFDATRSLAEATVGTLCGDARLYLSQVGQEEDATVITYGYAYRGAAIQVGREGWCARFTVRNGAVDAFVLKPRRYTAQEDYPAVLLPQEQAAAALPGPGEQSLELLYEDDGSSRELIPFWAVRAEGR